MLPGGPADVSEPEKAELREDAGPSGCTRALSGERQQAAALAGGRACDSMGLSGEECV